MKTTIRKENEAFENSQAQKAMLYVQNKSSEIRDSLNDCGIGHDVQQRFSEASKIAAKFCADLQSKICSQLMYDLMQNVPTGIIQRGGAAYHAKHAIERGLVSFIGAFVQWDLVDALNLGADIAEDVNAHGEAKLIREMANKILLS